MSEIKSNFDDYCRLFTARYTFVPSIGSQFAWNTQRVPRVHCKDWTALWWPPRRGVVSAGVALHDIIFRVELPVEETESKGFSPILKYLYTFWCDYHNPACTRLRQTAIELTEIGHSRQIRMQPDRYPTVLPPRRSTRNYISCVALRGREWVETKSKIQSSNFCCSYIATSLRHSQIQIRPARRVLSKSGRCMPWTKFDTPLLPNKDTNF